jgi:hypothetical protein
LGSASVNEDQRPLSSRSKDDGQMMHYGVAVTAQAIAKIHSKKLGMTIGEYLKQENLIDDPSAK